MNYVLIISVAVVSAVHILEFFIKKYRHVLAVASIVLHIAAMVAFMYLQLSLLDVFTFLLCSGLVSLFLKYKGEEHGF